MSSKDEIVTIGLPVFNGAEHIEDTLRSLLSQSYEKIRILVSDNASTDGTADIIRKMASRDGRIVLHQQDSNIGAAANFLHVLKEASTAWFMFAAHDDKWSPNYIESLLAASGKNPLADLIVPRVQFTFENGNTPIVAPVEEGLFLLTGLSLKTALLKAAHGSWLYGLHRTQALQKAYRESMDFPHVWGLDLMIILPAILRGLVVGTNDAVFSHLETPLSRQRYRPSSPAEQFALNRNFRQVAFGMLKREVASPWERFSLSLPLLTYCERHGFRFRRACKNWVLQCFRPNSS